MTGRHERREVTKWLESMRGADGGDGGDGAGGKPGWLPKNRAGAVAAILALLVMGGFWIWAFSPLAPSGHPDLLEHAGFTVAAEDICARTVAAIDELPGAPEATSPADRAGQIRTSTAFLEQMLTDLDAPAEEVIGPDALLIESWLEDWETYLGDRHAYADTLAGGSDPPFTVTARDGEAVTSYISIFAEVNAMASCATPGDV